MSELRREAGGILAGRNGDSEGIQHTPSTSAEPQISPLPLTRAFMDSNVSVDTLRTEDTNGDTQRTENVISSLSPPSPELSRTLSLPNLHDPGSDDTSDEAFLERLAYDSDHY